MYEQKEESILIRKRQLLAAAAAAVLAGGLLPTAAPAAAAAPAPKEVPAMETNQAAQTLSYEGDTLRWEDTFDGTALNQIGQASRRERADKSSSTENKKA